MDVTGLSTALSAPKAIVQEVTGHSPNAAEAAALDRYRALVVRLTDGEQIDGSERATILRNAYRSQTHLAADMLTLRRRRGAVATCEEIRVAKSKLVELEQQRATVLPGVTAKLAELDEAYREKVERIREPLVALEQSIADAKPAANRSTDGALAILGGTAAPDLQFAFGNLQTELHGLAQQEDSLSNTLAQTASLRKSLDLWERKKQGVHHHGCQLPAWHPKAKTCNGKPALIAKAWNAPLSRDAYADAMKFIEAAEKKVPGIETRLRAIAKRRQAVEVEFRNAIQEMKKPENFGV
jgi:hypothetical protein